VGERRFALFPDIRAYLNTNRHKQLAVGSTPLPVFDFTVFHCHTCHGASTKCATFTRRKVTPTMLTTSTVALLVAFYGPVQSDTGQLHSVRLDSAHTLFTPNAPDSGRAGQIFQLPLGGFGITTGGTSHYQTFGMPGGSGVAVPNGNNTFDVIGSGGGHRQ
jgi:hypothetical protein